MSITATGHQKLKDWLKSFIKEGRYTVNGVTKTTPIFQVKQEGDVVTFYLYLDDTVSGTITKIQLIDQDGAVFDDQPDNITKSSINGLLVAFKYTLKKV
jgi:hypothetical protein